MLNQKYHVNINNAIRNDKVYYEVIVYNDNNESKISMHRYSELKDFHAQLIKCITLLKLNIQIPEFPKRKLFGSTNKNQEAILSRQIELQNYFIELLNIEKILSLAPIQQYLPNEIVKQTSKITIHIERYTVYDDVVIYFMRFRNKQTKEDWIYKQRYSEIKNLHDALMEQGFKSKLPPFPSRKLFGMTNENPENIEKRREDLEVYLNALFSTKEVYDSEVIQFLIDNSKKEYEKNKQLEEMKRNSQHIVRGDLNNKAQQIQQEGEQMIRQVEDENV